VPMSRRTLGVAMAFVVAPVAALIAPVRVDAQAEVVGFDAVAAADGVLVLADSETLLPTGAQLAGFGGPTAQVRVSTLGVSEGFAAFPNPGEVPLSFSSVLAAFTGVVVPFEYPFVARSEHPLKPDDSFGQSGFEIRAHSEESRSSAAAAMAPGLRSAALALSDEHGTLHASAETTLPELALGELTVSGLVARAAVDHDGETTRSTDFAIGRIQVGDPLGIGSVSLGVGPDGLFVADTVAPLPVAGVLESVFEPAGFEVEYLEAVETETGVVSAGLKISTVVPVESAGSDVDVSFVLGRVSASINVAAPPAPSVAAGPVVDVAPPMTASAGAAVSPPIEGGAVLSDSAVAPPVTTRAATTVEPTPVSAQRLVPPAGWALYPVVALIAILLVGASHGFTVIGRRE